MQPFKTLISVLKVGISLSLISVLAGVAMAAEIEEPQLSRQAISPAHFSNHRSRPFPGTQRIVNQYIEEKITSGEIDASEYNQIKQQRQELRQELKTLRDSGDESAIEEKLGEIRQQRKIQRDYVRNLVQDDAELRQRLISQRQKIRLQSLDRRQEIIERRRERIQDRRYRDGAS